MMKKGFGVKMKKVFRDGFQTSDTFSDHKGMTYAQAFEWISTHPALKGFIKACAGPDYRIEDFEIIPLIQGRA